MGNVRDLWSSSMSLMPPVHRARTSHSFPSVSWLFPSFQREQTLGQLITGQIQTVMQNISGQGVLFFVF